MRKELSSKCVSVNEAAELLGVTSTVVTVADHIEQAKDCIALGYNHVRPHCHRFGQEGGKRFVKAIEQRTRCLALSR